MTTELVAHDTTYDTNRVYLTAFHGGEQGRCVQLTIQHGQYCSMTFKEAVDLFETWIAQIKKLGELYDKHPPWWELNE